MVSVLASSVVDCWFNGGVMVSVLASSVVDCWFSKRLCNWYLLLLCYARIIKKKEQRLAGSESR